MKIALVLASNILYSPYIYHYTRVLKENKINFDIITWNKNNILEKGCINFNRYSDLSKPKIFKIAHYLGYKKFVVKTLKNKKYDKIVVFTIPLGILLYPFLKRNYKKTYFFDIRDYSPLLKFSRKIIKPVIENSFCTAISSPGFLRWLPKSDSYVISHNYWFQNSSNTLMQNLRLNNNHIIITIGSLRQVEANKIVLNSFKNKSDFFMKFVGDGTAYKPLLNYSNKNNIKNVLFTGRYEKKDEVSFLKDASLMNILLGNDLSSSSLMTNRFYLAISNGIPVIVNKNSIQGEYVKKYNLGIAVEYKDSIYEDINSFLQNFNIEQFQNESKQFLLDIQEDQKKFETCILKFIVD